MFSFFFFFQAEDGIRDYKVTGVQTCALPISWAAWPNPWLEMAHQIRFISARIIHKYLLRHPILSPGGALLARPPRRTAKSTPPSSSLARTPGGLRSLPPRDGIHG